MTRDECILLCKVVEKILSDPSLENSKVLKNKTRRSWTDIALVSDDINVGTLWPSRTYTLTSAIHEESVDYVGEKAFIYGSTTPVMHIIDLVDMDDFDSLYLQYSSTYNTELIYQLVLISRISYLIKNNNDYSSLSLTFELLPYAEEFLNE